MSRSGVRSAFVAIIPWILVAVLGIVSIGPLVTPPARSSLSPNAISMDRSLSHIAVLAKEPHPMGTEANAEVRAYIVGQLTALGLEPELQTVEVPDYFGEPGGTVEVVNVMVRIPGTGGSKAVVLVGHYDSEPSTPGANDDAAAIAVMLEVGRVLRNGPSLAHDIILLFTDGEEPAPRFGSAAFIARHAWAGDVGFVINLEAAGGTGPSMVIETNGSSSWIIGGLVEESSDPVAFSFLTETAAALGGIGTDFDSFTDVGVPGIHFAYLRNSPIYHTPSDSLPNVDADSVGHHGSNALGVVRFFGNSDLAHPPQSGDDIFFTVGRSFVVRYPVAWSIPLVFVAVAVFGAAILIGARRQRLRAMGIVGSAGLVLGGAVLSVVVVSMIWTYVAGLRTMPSVRESYGYLAATVVISVGVWLMVDRLARMKWSLDDVLAGVVAVWLVLAAATGTTLIGMSYLFVLPALGASTLLLIRAVMLDSWSWVRIAGVALVAAPTLLVMMPPIDTFFQLALPRPGNTDSQMIGVIGVVAFLAFLSIALIASSLTPDASGEGTETEGAVKADTKRVLPQGHQPYDLLIGIRIGAFSGGVLGALVAAVLHIGWFIVIGAVAGGALGYLSERRRLRRDTSQTKGTEAVSSPRP